MRFQFGAVVLVLATSAGPGIADPSSTDSSIESLARHCAELDDAELQLDACSATIEAGVLTGADLAAVYGYRCFALGALGRYEAAVAECDAALDLEPDLARALWARGNTYRFLDDYAAAIADYEQALAAGGLSADEAGAVRRSLRRLRYDTAFMAYLTGQAGDGLDYIEAALDDSPEDLQLADLRASIYGAMARPEEAVAEFTRLIETGGEDYVRAMQRRLAAHGHYHSAIDGDWGSRSQTALQAWVDAGCPYLPGAR